MLCLPKTQIKECEHCNGLGGRTTRRHMWEDCRHCYGTGSGLRWHWMKPILHGWRRLIKPWQDWQYKRKMNKSLSEDEIPF